MDWVIVTFVMIQVWISTATKIFYVTPDNSTNATSCLSYSCATFSQYLLDNNKTLPVISNVQYYFKLPGKHQISTEVSLKNLRNLSIIGAAKISSAPVVLFGCLRSYIIKISDSYNVTIANVMFKRCDQVNINKNNDITNLLMESCHSCAIEKVMFISFGLKGINLIGNTYLSEIVIRSGRAQKSGMMFCQEITLVFWNWLEYTENKHFLIMNQINISSNNKCYNKYPIGVHIIIQVIGDLTIIMHNSLFYKLDHTALSIIDRFYGSTTVIIENCTFIENGGTHFNYIDELFSLSPLINIILLHLNQSVSFKQCSFTKNFNERYLISIHVSHFRLKPCIGSLTNITFMRCQFTKNIGELIKFRGRFFKANLFIIGNSRFAYNKHD